MIGATENDYTGEAPANAVDIARCRELLVKALPLVIHEAISGKSHNAKLLADEIVGTFKVTKAEAFAASAWLSGFNGKK